jgi:hypothetical protein
LDDLNIASKNFSEKSPLDTKAWWKEMSDSLSVDSRLETGQPDPKDSIPENVQEYKENVELDHKSSQNTHQPTAEQGNFKDLQNLPQFCYPSPFIFSHYPLYTPTTLYNSSAMAMNNFSWKEPMER